MILGYSRCIRCGPVCYPEPVPLPCFRCATCHGYQLAIVVCRPTRPAIATDRRTVAHRVSIDLNDSHLRAFLAFWAAWVCLVAVPMRDADGAFVDRDFFFFGHVFLSTQAANNTHKSSCSRMSAPCDLASLLLRDMTYRLARAHRAVLAGG
jgi:hypothetical protein